MRSITKALLTRLAEPFRVAGFRRLLLASFLWSVASWGGMLTTSYLLTRLSGTPALNQAAGALVYAPLLVGGLATGALTHRIRRKPIVVGALALVVPFALALALLVHVDAIRVWMTAPLMLALGIGTLAMVTAYRPLLYDTVGPDLATPSVALDSTAQALAAVVGSLAGGVLVDRIGLDAAYVALAALPLGSCLLLATVAEPPRPPHGDNPPHGDGAGTGLGSVRAHLQASAELVRRTPRLRALLAVTVVFNLFLFGYTPLVPVVAHRFGDTALVAGAIAAAGGLGQLVGSLALSSLGLRRHGLVFVCGCATALVGLLAFSVSPTGLTAALGLFVLGVGGAGFGSMQTLLAIESAPERARGTAVGTLSTAIGILPIGMMLLGTIAELIGTRTTLALSSLTGMACVAVVVATNRDLLAPAPVGGLATAGRASGQQ